MDPNSRKVPPEIASKLSTFESIRKRIGQLESDLLKAREEFRSLETELAQYQASVAPIGHLPLEILAFIFQEYVLTSPKDIRLLLLVCKRWHKSAIALPSLWTNIRLVFDTDIEEAATVEKGLKYAQACYQHSKTSPLDVTMDFSGIPEKTTFIERRLLPTALLDNQGFETLRGQWDSFGCLPYERLIKSCVLLSEFMASQMQRWRSFHISFDGPNDEVFQEIWPLFTAQTPILTDLVMDGCYPSKYTQTYLRSLTEVPRLTRLKVFDTKHFSLIAALDPPLQYLECITDHIEDLQNIYKFGELKELRLISDLSEPASFSSDSVFSNKLFLPFLEFLKLEGLVPCQIIDAIHAPSLQDLWIRRYPDEVLQSLPQVRPLEVIWQLEHVPILHHANAASVTAEIREIFQCYNDVRKFCTYKRYMRLVLRVLAEVREIGGMEDLVSLVYLDTDRHLQEDESDDQSLGGMVDVSIGTDLDGLIAQFFEKDYDEDEEWALEAEKIMSRLEEKHGMEIRNNNNGRGNETDSSEDDDSDE